METVHHRECVSQQILLHTTSILQILWRIRGQGINTGCLLWIGSKEHSSIECIYPIFAIKVCGDYVSEISTPFSKPES